MEDKLITLCILTYEKAQVLQSRLESEGIESYIHNVNLIQPMISAGVRVRISQQDLPMALKVLEMSDFGGESYDLRKPSAETSPKRRKMYLVPVDFSNNSIRALEYAIRKAAFLHAEITVLHIHSVPLAAGALPIDIPFTNQFANIEQLSTGYEKALRLMEDLIKTIRTKMDKKELPEVAISSMIREGIPEDEIIATIKELRPTQLFVGTQGGGGRHLDYLGSVTEELIERSPIPVLVIPEKAHEPEPNKIKKIAFLTNFSPKDLIAFDSYLRDNHPISYEVHLLVPHYTEEERLALEKRTLTDYFINNYPLLKVAFSPIEGNHPYKQVEEYIQKNSIDLLSLTSHKRGLFTRLLSPGIAGKMLFYTTIPLLVLK